MEIKVIDNSKLKLVDELNRSIASSFQLRFAVAFAKISGFSLIKESLQEFFKKSGRAIFLLGLDFSSTDPQVLRDLYDFQEKSNLFELLCYKGNLQETTSYHPKIYLFNGNENQNIAYIGSSNLTRGGLVSNIEANIMISSLGETEVFSDLSDTFLRLRLDKNRIKPNSRFIDKYEELYKLHRKGKNIKQQRQYQELIEIENELPRSRLIVSDLSGWMKLVYESLPDSSFTTSDIYQFEEKFRNIYPENRNIKAKIRQQLQYLRDYGLLVNPSRNYWKKV